MVPPKIHTERTTTPVGDADMELYVARPEAPRGAIVVLQEAFGVNEHIQDVAQRYASEGYAAVAPDLFHRFDERVIPYRDVARAKEQLARMDDDAVVADVEAAVAFARELVGPGRAVGVVGYCFGGRCAFVAATRLPDLAATVAYYGGGIGADTPAAPHGRAAAITSPVLALFGGRDPMIPADDVARIDASLTAAGVTHEVHVYEEAGHGFACGARPESFHAASAVDAWQRTVGFLATHLDR